jgi:hypothetical protein
MQQKAEHVERLLHQQLSNAVSITDPIQPLAGASVSAGGHFHFLSCFADGGFAREAADGNLKKIALVTGSIAMGGGIWAMHFVGMLAFAICSAVHYALLTTLLSMLPAIGAAWLALHMLARPSISRGQLWLSGTLVGSGIGIMHYSGMAAMQMTPLLRYDPLWFAASIVAGSSPEYPGAMDTVWPGQQSFAQGLCNLAGRQRHGHCHCRHALLWHGRRPLYRQHQQWRLFILE